MIFIQIPYLKVCAMAIYPFCLIQKMEHRCDVHLLNHEKIHFRQQIELLIVPFYLLYLLNYLILLLVYFSHDKAYRNIVFEREAYANQNNLNYLNQRRVWAFMSYFKS